MVGLVPLSYTAYSSDYYGRVDYTTTTPLFLNELPAFSCRPIHPLNPEQSPLANEIGGANDLEAFIQFLFNAEMLSSFHKRLDPVWFAHRHQMFKRGTVLHKLLTPPAEGDEWPRNRIPSYCIMAALMHIHVAFWENREARDLGDQCLKDLHRNLEQYYRGLSSGEEQGYPIHPNTSIGLFVWLLLKMDLEDQDQHVSGHCPMDEGRSWFVARVLRVAKLLSYRSWLRLNRVLLSLLEMTPDEVHGLASPETMAAWRDELRVEFLLTAFPW